MLVEKDCLHRNQPTAVMSARTRAAAARVGRRDPRDDDRLRFVTQRRQNDTPATAGSSRNTLTLPQTVVHARPTARQTVFTPTRCTRTRTATAPRPTPSRELARLCEDLPPSATTPLNPRTHRSALKRKEPPSHEHTTHMPPPRRSTHASSTHPNPSPLRKRARPSHPDPLTQAAPSTRKRSRDGSPREPEPSRSEPTLTLTLNDTPSATRTASDPTPSPNPGTPAINDILDPSPGQAPPSHDPLHTHEDSPTPHDTRHTMPPPRSLDPPIACTGPTPAPKPPHRYPTKKDWSWEPAANLKDDKGKWTCPDAMATFLLTQKTK